MAAAFSSAVWPRRFRLHRGHRNTDPSTVIAFFSWNIFSSFLCHCSVRNTVRYHNKILWQVLWQPTHFQYRSYCSTVHFRRITSIYQPTNAHIISHTTLLKHFKYSDMFRSCQIIIRELRTLLKLYYGIHNSIRICNRGVVAAYHVVWECVVEQWPGVRRTTHT